MRGREMPPPREAVPDRDRRQECGRRVRQLRARLYPKLDQIGLANRAGVGRSTIHKIENGEGGVSVKQLALVAKALFLPVEEINPECYAQWNYQTDEALLALAEARRAGPAGSGAG